MPNELGRGAEGWHLPGPACLGQVCIVPALPGMGLVPPSKAATTAPGPSSFPNPPPLPSAACESRPSLPVLLPGKRLS